MESTEHKRHLNLSTNLHNLPIFRQVGIFHFLSDHPSQSHNFINLVFVTSSHFCSLPEIWCSSTPFSFEGFCPLCPFANVCASPPKWLRSWLQETGFMAEPNLMIYSQVLIVSGSVKLVHWTTVRV